MADAGGELTLQQVLRRAKPAWKKSDVAGALERLEAIGVESVQEMRRALEQGRINPDLQKFGLKGFTSATLRELRDYLGIEAPGRCRAPSSRPPAEDGGSAEAGGRLREPPTAEGDPTPGAHIADPDELKAHGIHVDQLVQPEVAAELLRFIKKVKTMSVRELRQVIEEEGFSADDPLPRSMLVTAVSDVLIWKDLSEFALRPVCRKKGLAVEDDQPRDELLQLLADNSWVSVGIPLTRLPSLESAREILELVRGLRESDFEEVRGMCEIAGLETEERDQAGMIAELKQIAIWRSMEIEELRRECQAHSVVAYGAAAKEDLMDRLVACIQDGTWHTRGLPVNRLGSEEMAHDLIQHVDRFQAMSVLSLRSELRKMRLPMDPNDEPQKMVFRLRDRLLWDHLPVAELRKEIKLRGLVCRKKLDPRNRANMIDELLMDAYRVEIGEWESQGIPVHKMSNFHSMVQLVVVYKAGEDLHFDDLLEWYKQLGYPQELDMTRDDIMRLRALVRAWQLMPISDLQTECLNCQVSLDDAHPCENDAERRFQLTRALIAHDRVCMWDAMGLQAKRLYKLYGGKLPVLLELVKHYNSWVAVDDTELKRLLSSFGLPQEADLERDTLLRIVRNMMVWESLPIPELQLECSDRDLPVPQADAEGGSNDGVALVHLLVTDMCIRTCKREYEALGIPVEEMGALAAGELAVKLEVFKLMSGKELRAALENFGVPCKLGTPKDEMLKRLRRVTAWSSLPVDALKAECRREGIEFNEDPGGEPEEIRNSLLDSLLFRECKGVFETLGLGAQQFATFTACAAVSKQWVEIGELTVVDLRQRCEQLKGCNVFQMEKNEMRERLKQLAVWTHIPMKDLRSLCGKYDVPFDQFIGRHTQVQLLAEAVWKEETKQREPQLPQARRPQGAGGAGWQAPPKPAKVRGRMAEHFKTLELPVGAGLDDVKKAYRRLALSSHPDKHQGQDEDAASDRFVKIVQAYEALCEYLGAATSVMQP